jgi:hypothetical protein
MTLNLTFLVVEASSAYNAILGRGALNKLGAIVSTPHLMMKFPTPNGIGYEQGDQELARSCYLVVVCGGGVAHGTGGPGDTCCQEGDAIHRACRGHTTGHLGRRQKPEHWHSATGSQKDRATGILEETSGLSWQVAEHRLHVNPIVRLV